MCIIKNQKITIRSFQNEDYFNLLSLYEDEDIKDTFNGFRKDRIICSEYIFMINLNDIPIGFILLVLENKNQLGIDIGIIKKYRNKGYGKEAIRLLKKIVNNNLDKDLIAEVKKDNISANKTIANGGFKFYETKNNNINVYKYYKK